MKARLLILVLLCIFSFCCAPKLSVEEMSYLERVMKTPLVFTVRNEKAEIVWGRIQSYIGKYSPLKIQVAEDYVVQTYDSWVYVSYRATRTPGETETEFSIKRWSKSFDATDRNAHILAYYALTGELMPRLIKRE
jgi:hypothetical protein